MAKGVNVRAKGVFGYTRWQRTHRTPVAVVTQYDLVI